MNRTVMGGSRQVSHRAVPNHLIFKAPWTRAVSGHQARSFGPCCLISAQAPLPSLLGVQALSSRKAPLQVASASSLWSL